MLLQDIKTLVVSTRSCDSKAFEGKHLSLGQYSRELVIKGDCWEGKPLVQVLNTSPSGVLPYIVQVPHHYQLSTRMT